MIASDGRYHASFLRPLAQNENLGRPQDENVNAAFEYICNHIESNEDECQFSMKEILNQYKGEIPSEKILKKRLLDKFGTDIIISARKNRLTYYLFPKYWA